MSIQFSCDQCGKRFTVSDQAAGKRAKCKQCGATLTIPAAVATAEPARTTSAAKRPAAASSPPSTPATDTIYCLTCGMRLSDASAVCTNCGPEDSPKHGAAATTTAAAGFQRAPILIAAASVGGILFFVIVYAVIHLIVFAPPKTVGTDQQSSTPTAPTVPAITPPPAPAPRPKLTRIGNVDVFKMTIIGDGPEYPTKLVIYLPAGAHAPKSLPCVLIAPAGTRLFHGASFEAGDMPEHLPYAEAGFAVCAYELSGPFVSPFGNPTYRELREPAREFQAAAGGVSNAQVAINYILTSLAEVDPERLFAAGHSSAANVALDVAAEDHRLRGVAAYAPATDLESRLARAIPIMEGMVPGETAFVRRMSPMNRVNDIACPVFLFHADDDTNVPAADNQAFADAMNRAGKSIQFKRVPIGGHYQSMIQQGIPAGIAFFKSLGANPMPPAP